METAFPTPWNQELKRAPFAPVVFYAEDEPNLPTNVPAFLTQTVLWYYDKSCRPESTRVEDAAERFIPRLIMQPCAAGAPSTDSYGTRSTGKERTFFLANVTPKNQRGSEDSREWTTYYHAYPNDAGGITIQYWRFYAYNTGFFWGHRAWIGCHGGDWEAIHIALGPGPAYSPREILLLGHKDIDRKPFSSAKVIGTHIQIFADKGGHTSLLVESAMDEKRFVRHESWTGARVRWLPGTIMPGGALLNLGEKTAPMPGMEFLRYSGLWGTRESSGWFSGLRSGYWGPAFNETGMGSKGFITAWCAGMADSDRRASDPAGSGTVRECYPNAINP